MASGPRGGAFAHRTPASVGRGRKGGQKIGRARTSDGDQESGVVSTIVRFRQTQPLTSVPSRGLRAQSEGLCLRLKLSYCVIDHE